MKNEPIYTLTGEKLVKTNVGLLARIRNTGKWLKSKKSLKNLKEELQTQIEMAQRLGDKERINTLQRQLNILTYLMDKKIRITDYHTFFQGFTEGLKTASQRGIYDEPKILQNGLPSPLNRELLQSVGNQVQQLETEQNSMQTSQSSIPNDLINSHDEELEAGKKSALSALTSSQNTSAFQENEKNNEIELKQSQTNLISTLKQVAATKTEATTEKNPVNNEYQEAYDALEKDKEEIMKLFDAASKDEKEEMLRDLAKIEAYQNQVRDKINKPAIQTEMTAPKQEKTSEEIDKDLLDYEEEVNKILNSKHFSEEQKKQMIEEIYQEFDGYVEENPEHGRTR